MSTEYAISCKLISDFLRTLLFALILYADLNMDDMSFANSVADSVGHCSKSDLFTLVADSRRKENVVYRQLEGEPLAAKSVVDYFTELNRARGLH